MLVKIVIFSAVCAEKLKKHENKEHLFDFIVTLSEDLGNISQGLLMYIIYSTSLAVNGWLLFFKSFNSFLLESWLKYCMKFFIANENFKCKFFVKETIIKVE